MKIKSNYLFSFFQIGFLLFTPFIQKFVTLGDRRRYIEFQYIDLGARFSRTSLTDFIFNFGGAWLEFFLATISIFLHFYLVNSFIKTLKIGPINKIISILWLLRFFTG